MPKLEERDLFDVLEEWGYEVRAADLNKLSPVERESLLEHIKEIDPDTAEELMKCLPQS